MKLLCTADIHLGRQVARLPAALLERIERRALSPAAAWERLVELALERRVDALLLAGDVVEQDDDFYEALADLRRGVERLAAAGVRVLAVAGNHDVTVLPRLAAAGAGVELLGAGGRWSAVELVGGDGGRARVVGWSFPERTVATSPLEAPLPQRSGLPTIGLLHCDRGQTASRYAPVSAARLQAAPVDAWLLGHVHRPDALAGPRPIGYLGSLTGMDAGEPGPHGPWLLELPAAGEPRITQLPLAPLRWETLEVDVSDLAEADAVHGRVVAAIDALHAELAGEALAVGCRLRLVGRSSLRRELERSLVAGEPRRVAQERDDRLYFIHDWCVQVAPAVDLEQLARGDDPAGLLARRLLLLRGEEGPRRRDLVRRAQQRLAAVSERASFTGLDPEARLPPDDVATAALLERAALQALDALLAQRETEP